MTLNWPIRAGYEIVNDGYDLNFFYVARAPVVDNKMNMIVPGKVSEGSLCELKLIYILGGRSLIHIDSLSGSRARLEGARIH